MITRFRWSPTARQNSSKARPTRRRSYHIGQNSPAGTRVKLTHAKYGGQRKDGRRAPQCPDRLVFTTPPKDEGAAAEKSCCGNDLTGFGHADRVSAPAFVVPASVVVAFLVPVVADC